VPKSGQPRKRRGEGDQRRAEILDAARVVFARLGSERTTIRLIADEVGLSAPSVYAHFPDKMALYVAVSEAAFSELDASFAEARRITDPVERLRVMSHNYVHFGLLYPDAYDIAFAPKMEFRPGPSNSKSVKSAALASETGARVFDAFRHAVSETPGLATGTVDGDDVLARVMWATGHGIVSLSRSSADAFPEVADVYVDAFLDAFLAGVTQHPTETQEQPKRRSHAISRSRSLDTR
jgi:AcrR family transcriptional regulator